MSPLASWSLLLGVVVLAGIVWIAVAIAVSISRRSR